MDSDDVHLYPAIVKTFAVILLGYVAGRVRLITPNLSKGIGNYVTYFALPALLFSSLVELDFGQVNWKFWSCILAAKSIVFTATFVLTFFLGRDLGKAGIFSIFVSQSNDFALGFPIVLGLYKDTHPEFVSYLPLFAPISLAILNPLAFIAMEYHKNSLSKGSSHHRPIHIAWHIFKGIVCNPIIVTVFLGLVFNLILQQKLPIIIKDIFFILASSYSATALFYLGNGMVGKIKQQFGLILVVPATLIAAKILILPMLIRALVSDILVSTNTTEMEDLSMFGFVYGTFPTAPSIYLFSTQYGIVENIIAMGMVLCTLFSAPMMFISATMATLSVGSPDDYIQLIMQTSFDVSVVGIICCVWVLLVLILSKRFHWLPHNFTSNLVLSQLLLCLGVMVCGRSPLGAGSQWRGYLQKVLFWGGLLSGPCWTSMIALGLCLVRCRSTCYVLKHKFWFYIYGWGFPSFVVGILIAVTFQQKIENSDLIFQSNLAQLIVSVIVLSISILITMISLVFLLRSDRYKLGSRTQIPEEEEDFLSSYNADTEEIEESTNTDPSQSTDSPGVPVVDIEEIAASTVVQEKTCLKAAGCSQEQRRKCRQRLVGYGAISQPVALDQGLIDADLRHQVGHHVVLLFVIIVSMLVALFLSFWRLLDDMRSGIYIELEFLNSVLSYGQSFFVLATFGFDTQYVIMPLIKRWRRYWHGTENIPLPESSQLSEDVTKICDQFVRYHQRGCMEAIAKNRRINMRNFKDVFLGNEFVDWLLKVGLATERVDAVDYGTKLLIGQIFQHLHQEHYFHDQAYYYQFCEREISPKPVFS